MAAAELATAEGEGAAKVTEEVGEVPVGAAAAPPPEETTEIPAGTE